MSKEILDHSCETNAPPDVYQPSGGLAGWLERKAGELERFSLEVQRRRVLRQMLSTPEGIDEFIKYVVKKGWTITQVEQVVEWARKRPLQLTGTSFLL